MVERSDHPAEQTEITPSPPASLERFGHTATLVTASKAKGQGIVIEGNTELREAGNAAHGQDLQQLVRAFSTLITWAKIPGDLWVKSSCRVIPERAVSAGCSIKRAGRSVPPDVDDEAWGLWTVGDVNLDFSHGGLSLVYLRKVLWRTDGERRTKWLGKELRARVIAARELQYDQGLMVDRPENWKPENGWWIYVQPK